MTEFTMRGLIAMMAFLFSATLAAAPFSWKIEIDRLSAGPVILNNISADNLLRDQAQAGITVTIPVVEIPEQDLSVGPLVLACKGSTFSVVENLCREGTWSLRFSDDWPELRGTSLIATLEDDLVRVETGGKLGQMNWDSMIESTGGQSTITVEIPEQPITAFGFVREKIEVFSWISAGQISAAASLQQKDENEPVVSGRLGVSDVSFDSPDGLYAGLGVATRLAVNSGQTAKKGLVIAGELSAGELLLMDFYRDFSDKALKLEALADWSETEAEISRFRVTDEDALEVVGQASLLLNTDDAKPELVLREFRLDFPLAYERYLESAVSIFSLDGLATSGSISWAGDWSPGSARSGELGFDRFSVSDEQRGRFTIEGLDGRLLTGTDSRLTWDAFSFVKMNLGSGHAALELSPEHIALTEPLTIGVLGGELELEALSFSLPKGGTPDVQLQASVNGIEMLQMSRAMGWPEFAGTLNGKIPGVGWKDGVIEIDGALAFQVFSGELVLTDLRVERPFGVLPSMAANITATGLDLEELTQTFEFGRIGGRADGYVRNLRMLDWQPVQFDAWFGTPVNDEERHGISRKAVQHLTSIGGGSATAILSGPILKLFNNFSYKRLGLGCVLRNNICHIRGVEEQGEAVLLMEGAGIPKISIQAFNRSVDWQQLLAELTAVSGGDEIRIGN